MLFLRLSSVSPLLLLPYSLLFLYTCAQQADDYISILQQLNLHQEYIDNPPDAQYSSLYVSLYWPEAVFTSYDLLAGKTVGNGHPGIKQAYDYDHSVFPLYQWFHTVGRFNISVVNQTRASVHWRWRVDWKGKSLREPCL